MASVIMVEDDEMLRDSIQDFLLQEGHFVRGVPDIIQFYKYFSQENFNAAVVDINLPHSDGFEIVKYLRENTALRIIITSVRSSLEDRIRGYRSGVDIYLTKPLHPEELSAALFTLESRSEITMDRSSSEIWWYDTIFFQLISPNGISVPLSQKESKLISYFASMGPGAKVIRDDVLNYLRESNTENSRRNLDTLISRLRSKTKQISDRELPLVTLQGFGFIFEARVEVKPQACRSREATGK